MEVIAEAEFDLSYSAEKMRVRLYAPQLNPQSRDWSCRFEIDEPIAISREIYGISSMQALCLAMKTLSAYLYGSDVYKNKELGVYGELGGNLIIPASHEFLESAPYPF